MIFGRCFQIFTIHQRVRKETKGKIAAVTSARENGAAKINTISYSNSAIM